MGACVVDVAAQHAAPIDAHGPGRVDPHRPPQPARVPRRIDRSPSLEHAGDGALRLAIALRRAGDLDRQHVLAGEARQAGDVEAVREEVALGVAEVGAVEPHVGLVEHPSSVDEAALPSAVPVRGRSVAVDQRSVVAGERSRLRQWLGTSIVGQSSSAYSRPTPLRRSSSSATSARHCPDRSTTARIRRGSPRGAVSRRKDGIWSTHGTRAHTLGDLKASGWQSTPVKEEIRAQRRRAIAAGEALFEGVLGYEHTVMPQLENALLAGHDVIFLGERGQAKTRIIRSLTGLLDEWMPIVAGSEINDDPYHPVSQARPRPDRRVGRRHADRMGPPRRSLRREARHPRHLDRRPHRRGRPDQGRRGPLPLRRADAALRARAAHQPRHLRDQRDARPRRAHPGRPAQRARRARRAGPRLQDPPAARRVARRLAPTPRTTPTAAASSRR